MSEEDDIAKARRILTAVETTIEQGDWEANNYLRLVGQKLQTIREQYREALPRDNEDKSFATANLIQRVAMRSGQQEVFVSLYSSDGSVLGNWERILSNLPRQIISRPIYTNEEDIKAFIKSKENPKNEAYVALFVNQSDILQLSQEKIPHDKFGKPLLSLKDNAIDLNNLTRMIHMDAIYTISEGRIVKK